MPTPPLASKEAITSFGRQVVICLELGDALGWPQIKPEYGQEILRELGYWRKKAGLLPQEKRDEHTRDQREES